METDQLSSCPVCFEPYKNVGDGVPRILPCHCTLCHKCIGKLLKGKTVVCPQNRQAHAAVNGIITFPQNKYVLIYSKNKSKDIKAERLLCKKHKEDEKLFCRTEGCRKPICAKCQCTFHKGHDVVDLLDEVNENQKALLKKVEEQIKNIKACKETLIDSKQAICNNLDRNMTKLARRKKEQCDLFDERLAKLSRQMTFLKETKAVTNGQMTYNSIIERTQTYENLTSALNREVQVPFSCQYSELNDTESILDIRRELLGIRVQKVVHVTSVPHQSVKSVHALPNKTFIALEYEGLHLCEAYWFFWKLRDWLGRVQSLLPNIPFGAVMMQYDMNGKEIHKMVHSVLRVAPSLIINGQGVLPVFLGNRIEYRNINSLGSVIPATSVNDSFFTCAMCPINQTTLLIGFDSKFFSLDHTYKPPNRTFIPVCHQYNMQNMCCVKDRGNTLVVIASDWLGIFAYCLQSGALIWCTKDLPGDNTEKLCATDVATDKRDKIFVCDEGNGCIHVFSPDGAYVSDLIRRGEHGLGSPTKISWNDFDKSLLVAHKKDGLVYVSFVKVSI